MICLQFQNNNYIDNRRRRKLGKGQIHTNLKNKFKQEENRNQYITDNRKIIIFISINDDD